MCKSLAQILDRRLSNDKARATGAALLVAMLSLFVGQAAHAQNVQTLTNNQIRWNLAGAAGSYRHFAIWMPAGQSRLNVKTWGGYGDADLYVRYGAPASVNTYFRRSWSSSNTESIAIDNPSAGWWYIAVRGYGHGSGYSGVNLQANFTAPSAVALSGGYGSMRRFYTNVPAGTSRLTIRTFGGAGNPNLFVRYGALPTPYLFHRASMNAGPSEVIVIYNPTPGRWNILVHGASAYSNVRLQVIRQ